MEAEGGIPGVSIYDTLLNKTHVLIAGTTGSGKSVLMNGMIYQLLCSSPSKSHLVLIDPKRVEFWRYRECAHTDLYASSPEGIQNALNWLVDEMEARYGYMRRHNLLKSQEAPLYCFVDEFADLMTVQKKETLPQLCRIAQLGRAANIHLIIATQRPTRDIITGQIKVNLDTRIALRVSTEIDSRNIIGIKGAERLPLYGQGIMVSPEYLNPIQFEIPMVSEARIQQAVNFWSDKVRV